MRHECRAPWPLSRLPRADNLRQVAGEFGVDLVDGDEVDADGGGSGDYPVGMALGFGAAGAGVVHEHEDAFAEGHREMEHAGIAAEDEGGKLQETRGNQ